MFSYRLQLLAVLSTLAFAAQSRADFVVGLVGDGSPFPNGGTRLTTFDSATPGTTTAPVTITGLRPSERIIGIDFRPATPGVLVGVGRVLTSTSIGSGFVYTIDVATGVATVINSSGFTLDGTSFGVDFNPVPNALRIVSINGQNLRITAGGTGTVNSDTALSENGIVAAAYSNNFAGATVTTLYELNAFSGSLVRQGGLNGPPSPNGGVITTIGPLNRPIFGGEDGFDIAGSDGTAYATLSTVNVSNGQVDYLFHTIDLNTGQANLVGDFGGLNVVDISVQPVPAPAGVVLLTLGMLSLGIARRRKSA